MFGGLLTITVESFLTSIVTFLFLLAIIAVIFRVKELYCRIPPRVVLMICAFAIIRLLYPFDIFYGHEFIYSGQLRNLFISLNTVWDRDVHILRNVSVVNIVFIVWITGAVIRIVKMILDYKKSMAFIQKYSDDITDETLLERGISVTEKDYIGKRQIKIFKTKNIYSPLCCGLISPVILVPEVKEISEKHLGVIVDHELQHVKQGDLIVKLFMAVARLIYWWFPPFGMLCRYASLAIEMKTDIKASQKDKVGYMQGIVDIMEMMDTSKGRGKNLARLHPLSLFSQESEMKKRFTRLTREKKDSPSLSAMVVLITGLLVTSSMLFCVTAKHTYEEQNELNQEEGFFAPNKDNAKIIKHDSGVYELQMMLENGYVVSDYQENLYGFSRDIKIYNEQGEELKWPFWGRLR